MTPTLSVLMAVRDASSTIDEQLAALHEQRDVGCWELLVADTGSRDGTQERLHRWAASWPAMRVIQLGTRLEYAVPDELLREARADRLAFCDGDDVVGATWVEALASALEHHELVTGPLDLRRLNPRWARRGEDVAASMVRPPVDSHLPFGLGCNLGIRRELLMRIDGFDRSLPSGHDKDLCWRSQHAGAELHFAPRALVHRRLRHAPVAAFRQHVRYGRSNARLHARYRTLGDRRQPAWRWAAAWTWLVTTAPAVAISRAHRLHWSRVAGLRCGRLIGSLEHRTWFP